METGNGREGARTVLTQEEEASLPLLEPLFTNHLDLIFETLALHLGSDPDVASLLSDDLAVARLKRVQQDYLRSLLNGHNGHAVNGNGAASAAYRDPFGLGPGWHLRTFVHFLTAIQPLLFESFGTNPRLYHTVWNALLKVIFHDLELAMSASLTERDARVEAAWQDVSEMKRALGLSLSKQTFEKRQHQAEQRTLMSLLAVWRTKMSGLAQEMGTPLNVILGHAELLLEGTEDAKTQAALQSIVRQIERLIPLRAQLCSLDHGSGRGPQAPDLRALADVLLSSRSEHDGEPDRGLR